MLDDAYRASILICCLRAALLRDANIFFFVRAAISRYDDMLDDAFCHYGDTRVVFRRHYDARWRLRYCVKIDATPLLRLKMPCRHTMPLYAMMIRCLLLIIYA